MQHLSHFNAAVRHLQNNLSMKFTLYSRFLIDIKNLFTFTYMCIVLQLSIAALLDYLELVTKPATNVFVFFKA